MTGYWKGSGAVDATSGGVSGYWVQGTFASPFAVASAFIVGWSTPVTLVGSPDGVAPFVVIPMRASSSAACSSTTSPCTFYVNPQPVPARAAYSVYRVVTPASNYNSAVTLLTAVSNY